MVVEYILELEAKIKKVLETKGSVEAIVMKPETCRQIMGMIAPTLADFNFTFSDLKYKGIKIYRSEDVDDIKVF